MKSMRCPQARWRLTAACGMAIAVTIPAAGSIARPVLPRTERRPDAIELPTEPKVNPSFGSLPISFEPNVGQAPDGVRFLTRGSAAALTATGAVLAGGATPVSLEFVGASGSARASGAGELPGKANYLVGNDPSKWRTNVPTYSSVRIEQLYEGVDLVWYGKGRSLEYDLVVSPGADPDSIAFELEGFPSPELEAGGALVAGSVRLERPFAYQEIDGARRSVASRYAVRDSGRVAFELGDFDHSLPLVVDPEIGYSFSLAESTKDIAVSGISVDQTGSAYVVGSSAPAGTGARDVYIAKLNPEGTALVYSTTIGGTRYDLAYDVAVDDAGSAFVTGETASSDFPTTAGAFQPAFASSSPGDADAFVLRLAPDGATLVYASYLGGAKFDHGKDIVIDAPGNAYVIGTTTSTNFPTTEPEQAGNGGLADAFMTIVNPTGSAKVASTYLGGSESDNGEGIAIDPDGNVYVVGATSSTNFPVSPGALQSTFGGGVIDGFWAKYDPSGQRVASTYLGGSGVDVARALVVDAAGNSYLTGETDVTDFPGVSPVGGKVTGGSRDAFVVQLNVNGTEIEFSISFGGSQYESGNAIDFNSGGLLYIAGDTYSSDVTLFDPIQVTFGGGISDAFLLQCDPNAPGPESIQFCTYIGDERTNFGVDCGVGPNDEVCVASTSPDLSPDGSENDEGGVVEFTFDPAGPKPDLKVSLAVFDYTPREGRPSAIVHVIVRSTNECAGPKAPNATFSVEIPFGLEFVGAAGGAAGIRVVSTPPVGQPGVVTFAIDRAVELDGTDRGTVGVSLPASVPSAGPFQLEASASISDALECNYRNNTVTGVLDIGKRVFQQGARLLEFNVLGDPTAPPTIQIVNNATSPGALPSSRLAGGTRRFNVYASTQAGVQPVPSNFFVSVPDSQSSVDVSTAPAGSFFVVTTATDDSESAPSNEVGGVLPTVTKLRVSATKLVAQGTGFAPGLRVLFGGLSFTSAASLKKNNTKVIQKGPLVSGQSIGSFADQYLSPGAKVVILFVNANGSAVAVEYTR